VAECSAEIGVPERTARRRLALASDLADHPDLAAKVDNHEMTAKRARRVRREREAIGCKLRDPASGSARTASDESLPTATPTGGAGYGRRA